ncbi:type I-F CRISPR-associated endoribonuclease Cas6/Csy4 [Luteimonas sp. A478]
MGHYLDIRLRPDPELAPPHILSALYARFHRALVELGSQDIGVSFPAHDDRRPTLGNHVRVHGVELSLQALMATPWLRGIEDHLEVAGIAVVPDGARHRVVSRVQPSSSPARMRRRAMRRHGLDMDAAERRIPDSAAERLCLPFVQLGSRSTGQARFPLFIRHGPVAEQPIPGTFSSYGLSGDATVPWFGP